MKNEIEIGLEFYLEGWNLKSKISEVMFVFLTKYKQLKYLVFFFNLIKNDLKSINIIKLNFKKIIYFILMFLLIKYIY